MDRDRLMELYRQGVAVAFGGYDRAEMAAFLEDFTDAVLDDLLGRGVEG